MTWNLIADYADSSGRYRIEVDAVMQRMRTTWGDGDLGVDAGVQIMTRAARFDTPAPGTTDRVSDRVALGEQGVPVGADDTGDVVYIDGHAYVVWGTL